MKKTLALILAVVLSLACFCGAAIAEEEMPRYKIGVIYYSLVDTLGTETVKMCEQFGEMFNCEMQFIQASSSDENLTAFENLCAADCQAVVSCFVDAALPSILQIADNYGVYYGAISREIPSEEIRKTVEAMPQYKWWIGGCRENEYEAGYSVIDTLAKQYGCTKFALVGNTVGGSSAHDDRFKGFYDALEDNGLTAVTEGRGTSAEQTEYVNNMLTMDIDAFAVSGGGMDKCIQPVAAAGKTGQIKIGTIDIGEGALEALSENSVHVLLGGHAIDAVYSLVNAYNHLSCGDQPYTDLAEGEKCNLLLKYIVVDSAEVYADYLKYVDGEVAPYTVDELKSVMPYYNPDATYADLQAMVDAWSIEDVATRHAEFFN